MWPPLPSPPLPGPGQARRRHGGGGGGGLRGACGGAYAATSGPHSFPPLVPPPIWSRGGFRVGAWGVRELGVPCSLPRGPADTRGGVERRGRVQGGGKSSRKNPTSQPGRRGGRLAGRVCGLTHLQNFLPSPGSVFATLRLSFRRLFLPLFLSPCLCPLVLCPSISPALAARPSVQPLPPRLFVSPQDSAPLCPDPPWSL